MTGAPVSTNCASKDRHWIELARRLEYFRLYRGARRAFDRVRELDERLIAERDHLVDRATDPAPNPGLYFLATTAEGLGFALPLTALARIGDPASFLGEDARAALKQAHAAVSHHVARHGDRHDFPALSCKFPIDVGELCTIDGPSLGLAAALAFTAVACDQEFDLPVLVTGELTDNGMVHTVGGLELKVRAALEELGTRDGLVLVPDGPGDLPPDPRVRRVRSLSDALLLVWGASDLRLAPHLLDFSMALKKIRQSFDNHQNIAQLRALDRPDLTTTDRALLVHELMIQHRHAGETEEAARCYQRLGDMMNEVRHLIDGSTIQEMELQRLGNELNRFPGKWFTESLQQTLAGPLDLPNRVRCLGLLARFESVNGEHDRAIEHRLAALELQRQRADLRRRTPVTLCHLTWELARAGRRDDFLRVAQELQAATSPGDAHQWSYNHHALVAGALRFGLHGAVCAFLEGGEAPVAGFNEGLRDFFSSDAMVTRFPFISTLRQLIRACRKAGHLPEAQRLGRRFNTPAQTANAEESLERWPFLICALERDLAWCDFDGSGVESIRRAPDDLLACHLPAAIFYQTMLDTCATFDGSPEAIEALEKEMEGLYY